MRRYKVIMAIQMLNALESWSHFSAENVKQWDTRLSSFHTIYTKADNYYPTINFYGGTSLSTKLVSHVSNALRNNRNTMRF